MTREEKIRAGLERHELLVSLQNKVDAMLAGLESSTKEA